MAPEILNGTGYDFSVDYWALGVLLYEFLVGITPFAAESPFLVYKNIMEKKVRFPKDADPSKDINPAAVHLIKHLLERDTTKRLGCLRYGAKEVMAHKFYRDSINFNEIRDLKEQKFQVIKPPFSSSADTQNYEEFPDVQEQRPSSIPKEDDPFMKWK